MIQFEEKLGGKLRCLREQKHETQEETAKQLGISREVLNHWEHGTRKIKARELVHLAQYYEISLDWLLETGTTSAERCGYLEVKIENMKRYFEMMQDLASRGMKL